MNLTAEQAVYSALRDVFSDGAYSAQSLNRAFKMCASDEKAYVTRLFYGVLDKSIQFDYIIAKIADKKPQSAVAMLLKIGLYLLRYTDTPAYAAISKTVDLAKLMGKSGASGFVNAVLKQSQSIQLPAPDNLHGLSIAASYPGWIVKKIIADYGFAFARELLLFELTTETHIRINKNRIPQDEFETKYSNIVQNRSEYGYYVTHSALNKLKNGDFIIQSLASMRAVHQYLVRISPKSVLDLCAAPGGKAVYLKELLPSADVTACDIHTHRVELMRKYADSAQTNLMVMQNDATVFREEFNDRFDLVICDVPCSGIGVASKKPEILWNRSEEDIRKLSCLQFDILKTASRYVKAGGRLSYSTCTLFRDENEHVCKRFLKEMSDFNADGKYVNLFPHTDGCDGFFVANFLKNNREPS